jgi:hypothetical protein
MVICVLIVEGRKGNESANFLIHHVGNARTSKTAINKQTIPVAHNVALNKFSNEIIVVPPPHYL